MSAAAQAPEISVVIPTYRRHEALARSLRALETQTVPARRFEVIVVDDPEEDDPRAVEAAVASEHRPFRTRRLSRGARGVSAARNVGWRAGAAPLVLFLGDDMLADRRLLAEHLSWHDERGGDRVGVLGHVRWAREIRSTPFMCWLERGIQFDYPAIRGTEASWAHFYTANVSLPRALLEEIGGFDEERFPFLYEDLDVGYRLAGRGFRLLYNRGAVVEHLHPTTLEEWRSRMAATARAELEWVRLHPELPAYFRDKFAEAEAERRAHGAGRLLLRWVPPSVPVIGPRIWRSGDLYFRQKLAGAFLEAWRAAERQ